MDRRGFLGAIAAGTLTLLLPSLAKAAPTPVVPEFYTPTAAGLSKWMEDRFIASMGEARAFFELSIAEAIHRYGKIDLNNVDTVLNMTNTPHIARFVYITLAIATEGDDPVAAEARLVQAMMERLEEIEAKQHVVWRVKPHFEHDQITEYGDTWMTREQMEDRVDIPRFNDKETEWMKKQSERGVTSYWSFNPQSSKTQPPINVPEGVEFDFNTETLRYVKRKYTLNKLRMRLVFPNMPSEFAEKFYAQYDGATTVRI